MRIDYPSRVCCWLVVLLASLTAARAQQAVAPLLGKAANYGLLSGADLTADAKSGPLPIRVRGGAGAQGTIGAGVQASAGVNAGASGGVPDALTDAQAARSACTALGGSSLPGPLDGQTLGAGTYLVAGSATLGNGARLTLTGDTATVIVLNITGSLALGPQARVVLSGVLPQHVFWNVTTDLAVATGASFSGVALAGGDIALMGTHFGFCALLSQGAITLADLSPVVGSNQFFAAGRPNNDCTNSSVDCTFVPPGSELILDGSFELARCLPTTYSGLQPASDNCHWQSGTDGSADYYHADGGPEVSVPTNVAGGSTLVRAMAQNSAVLEGQAYAGFIAYDTDYPNYYEYVGQQNTSPLRAGHHYYAEFAVRWAPGSGRRVHELGMAIIDYAALPLANSQSERLPYTPVVRGSPMSTPTTGPDNSWHRIGGVYSPTVTRPGFTVLIGNFAAPGTNPSSSGNSPVDPEFENRAYYFVDNVTLSMVTEAGDAVTLGPTCLGGNGATSVTLGTPPIPQMVGATYSWTASDGSAVPQQANPTVSPSHTTTYTLTVTVPVPVANTTAGQPTTQPQTFSTSVTVTVVGYDYAQNPGATYVAPAGLTPYQIGVAGTTTLLNANGGTVTFDGRYQVLGSVRFTNGTFRLRPGTVFFIDSDYTPATSAGAATRLTVDGATLHLLGATLQATACTDHQWEGVYLANGGVLRSAPYNNPFNETDPNNRRSLVRDMLFGINSSAGNHYYLSGTDFLHNEYSLSEYAQDKVALPGEGVTNCLFRDGRYGIVLSEIDYLAGHTFGGNYSQAQFSGNTFQDLRQYGIYATAGLGQFAHNTFRNCGLAAIATWSVPDAGSSLISNNLIEVPATPPPGSPPGYAPLGLDVGDNAQVSSNTIRSAAGAPAPSAAASTPRIGISFGRLESGNSDQIIDNTITGLDWGFTASTDDYVGNTLTARRNTFHNTGAGIVFFPYWYPNANNPATTTANLTCNTFRNEAGGPADPVGIWLRNKARLSSGLHTQTVNGTPVGNGNAFIGYQHYSPTTPQHAVVNDNLNSDRFINYRPYDSQYERGVLGTPPSSNPSINSIATLSGTPSGNVLVAVARTVSPANSPNVCPTSTGVQNFRLALATATLMQQLDSLRLFGTSPSQQLRLLQALVAQPITPESLAALDAYGAQPEAVGREVLNLHLLHAYRQQRDQASAQRLRNRLHADNPADVELTAYLQLDEALDHMGNWLPVLRPLSPTNRALLSRVAVSGTTSARTACRLLRAYEPTCACHLYDEQPGSAAHPPALAARPAPPYPALAAYPNPATTALHVPYALPIGTAAAELRVYDATGRLTLRQAMSEGAGEVQLATAAWAPGLYQLVLTAGSRILGTQRIAILAQP